MKGANAGYFGSIVEGIVSSWTGLKLSFRHMGQAWKQRKPIGVEDKNYFDQQTGLVTLQYPHESIPVPDNGRYRLYNEIEDCIVCDLCAKICPVNCIEIEPIKSTEEIGKTSDGTTKRIYAAKFDIDMAKCCYCGLCTTVCPTECLTMTKSYDYSEFDVRNMLYHFTDLSPEEAEKKRLILEEAQALKAAAKTEKAAVPIAKHEANDQAPVIEKKPAFKPVIKAPVAPGKEKTSEEAGRHEDPSGEKKALPKPAFKPVIPAAGKKKEEQENTKAGSDGPVVPELGLKTTITDSTPDQQVKPKPFKPVIKPPIIKKKEEGESENQNDVSNDQV